jgi:hypothetical protein
VHEVQPPVVPKPELPRAKAGGDRIAFAVMAQWWKQHQFEWMYQFLKWWYTERLHR